MTVAATTSRMPPYVGTGAASSFAYTFKILADTDLRVVVVTTAGVETVLTLTTHYTLTGVGEAAGGTIVLVNGGFAWQDAGGDLATGYSLVPLRVPSLLQESAYADAGRYAGRDAEKDLDRRSMAELYLQDQADRSLRFPDSEVGTATTRTMPALATRKGTFLAFDPTTGAPLASVGSGTPATSFGATLVAAITAAAAMTVLGFSTFFQTLIGAASAAATRTLLGSVMPTVTNLAALKALTSTDLAGYVFMAGYTTAGDGGGGVFRWVAADAATANDGTIVAPTAGGGRFYRIYDTTVSVKWFGAKGDGATNDTTAFTNALAAAFDVYVPAGTYQIASTLTLRDGQKISGVGQSITGSIIRASAAGITLFKLTVARNTLENLQLEGYTSVPASYTGTAIQVADTDFSGNHTLRNVRTYYWSVGLRLAGALWTTCYDCKFTYGTVGIDFNAGTGSLYSTTTAFVACLFGYNQRQGVVGSNIPVRNTAISFIACTIEQNALEAPGTYPQYALGDVQNVLIENCYVEYSTAGTKPIGLNITNHAEGRIHAYVNGSSTGIKATTGTVVDVLIHNTRTVGSTVSSVDVGNATRCRILDGQFDSTVTVSGTGSQQITDKLAETAAVMTAFTPVLKGTSGTFAHTYVWQAGWYSRVGNVIHFSIVIRLSAKDAGMTGNAIITGMPVASANQTLNYMNVHVPCENVTFSANKNGVYAQLVLNATQMELYEQSSNGGSAGALPSANIGATSILYITGSYLA